MGQDTLYVKLDVKSVILVHPSDRCLLGQKEAIYIDMVLQFGLYSTPHVI